MKNFCRENNEGYFETKNIEGKKAEMKERIGQMEKLDQNNPLAKIATQMAEIAAQERMRRDQ